MAARAILPPSSGKAGIRLKTSTSALIVATQLSHTSAGLARTPPVASAASKKWLLLVASWPASVHSTITARVTSGPATATRNSTPGVCGSPLRVIPPNAHRSMPATGRPLRRATSA